MAIKGLEGQDVRLISIFVRDRRALANEFPRSCYGEILKEPSFTDSRCDSSGETEVAPLHLDCLLCKQLECQLQCPLRQTTSSMLAAQHAILIVQVIVK